jgi:hypothetical protein
MFEQQSAYYLVGRSEPKMVKPNNLKYKTIKAWGNSITSICFQIEETDTLSNKKITIQHYRVSWFLNWNKTKLSNYIFSNDQDNRSIEIESSVGLYIAEMLEALYHGEINGTICNSFIENILHFLEIENAIKDEQSEFEIHLPHYYHFYAKKIEKSKLKMVRKIMNS